LNEYRADACIQVDHLCALGDNANGLHDMRVKLISGAIIIALFTQFAIPFHYVSAAENAVSKPCVADERADAVRVSRIKSDRAHGVGEYKGLKPTPEGVKAAYLGPFRDDPAVMAEKSADLTRAIDDAEAKGERARYVPDWYIVNFHEGYFPYYLREAESELVRVSINGKTLDDEAREIVAGAGGKLSATYQISAGFAAKIPPSMVEEVRRNPLVSGVHKDAIGYPAGGEIRRPAPPQPKNGASATSAENKQPEAKNGGQ
jgi:hypothetical protein